MDVQITKPTKPKQFTLEKGVVYLRDRRNGRIFPYEPILAELAHIERFEYDGESVPELGEIYINRVPTTQQEKAAEWDRLAAMQTAARKAALEEKEKYENEQKRLEEETKKEEPKTLVMTNPDGPSLEAFKANGWTEKQLVEHGYAEYK